MDAVLPRPRKLRPKKHHPAMAYQHIAAFMTKLRERGGTAARAL